MACTDLLGAASSGNSCGKGTFNVGYWTLYNDIDWALTKANFTAATRTLSTTWVMQATKVWYKLDFSRKEARYDFTYTNDQGFYEMMITGLWFKGLDPARSAMFNSAVKSCAIVFHLFDSVNCTERIIGAEYDAFNDEFVRPLDDLRIERHLDTNGGFAEISRDEIDLKGEQIETAWYGDITQTVMDGLT